MKFHSYNIGVTNIFEVNDYRLLYHLKAEKDLRSTRLDINTPVPLLF